MNGSKVMMTVFLLAGLNSTGWAEHGDGEYAPAAPDAPKKVSIAVYTASGPCEFEYVEKGEIKTKKQTITLKPKYFCGPGSEKACDAYKSDSDARKADAEASCRFDAKQEGGTFLKASIDTSRCSYSEADYCPAD